MNILYFVFALLLFSMIGCQVKEAKEPERNPEGMAAVVLEYVARHDRGGGYQGHTAMPGLQVYWAGITTSGATPEDVIAATIERMQFEQSTDMASDQQAKALVLLMQARDELRGGQQFTEDGLPILE